MKCAPNSYYIAEEWPEYTLKLTEISVRLLRIHKMTMVFYQKLDFESMINGL